MLQIVQFAGVVVLTVLPLTFPGRLMTLPDPAKVGEMMGKCRHLKYLSTAPSCPTAPHQD